MVTQRFLLFQKYGNLLYFLREERHYLIDLLRVVGASEVDGLVSCIINTLFGNPFDNSEELMLISLMQALLQEEFDACKDLTTFLRENSAPPKLLSAFTRFVHFSASCPSLDICCSDFVFVKTRTLPPSIKGIIDGTFERFSQATNSQPGN
jgi:hypothetical protein